MKQKTDTLRTLQQRIDKLEVKHRLVVNVIGNQAKLMKILDQKQQKLLKIIEEILEQI